MMVLEGLLVHCTTQLELSEFGVQRGFTRCWLQLVHCADLLHMYSV